MAEPKYGLGDEVTYDSLADRVRPVREFSVTDPVTTINWLTSRGFEDDRSAVFGGLQSLRELGQLGVDPLSERANLAWGIPLRRRPKALQ